MMKLFHHFRKDMILSFRSWYIYTEFIMAAVFILIVQFVLADSMESTNKVYFYSEISHPIVKMLEEEEGTEEFIKVNSKEGLYEQVKEERESIGMILGQENQTLIFTLILQGYENDRFKNLLETSLESFFMDFPKDASIEIESLEQKKEKLSYKMNLLPVYLTMNSSFMGLFIIASYVFLDKKQGTIRALAVTASTVREYLASKMMVLLVTGVVTGMLVVFFVAFTQANYWFLLLLLLSTNVFGSGLGLLIASFFDNIIKAMGWLYTVIMLLIFPAISYFVPAYSPWYLNWIPSKPMMFAFREVFVKGADGSGVYVVSLLFLIFGIVLFYLAEWKFRSALTVS